MKFLVIALSIIVLWVTIMYLLDWMIDEWWPDDEEDEDFDKPDDWYK